MQQTDESPCDEAAEFWGAVFQIIATDPHRAVTMAFNRGFESALVQCEIHAKAGVPIPRPGAVLRMN